MLLLDEIEKAHQNVFNILLQVFDDARLTNSNGKTVYFDNVYVIMTSNAGASAAQSAPVGFGNNTKATEIDKAVEKTFTPEFRNRLDAVVKFNPLRPENMVQIVNKFLKVLVDKATKKGIELVVKPDAMAKLAELGFDPKMGARPLARVIDDKIKKPLSREIIFGNHKEGSTITVDVKDGEFTMEASVAAIKQEEVVTE